MIPEWTTVRTKDAYLVLEKLGDYKEDLAWRIEVNRGAGIPKKEAVRNLADYIELLIGKEIAECRNTNFMGEYLLPTFYDLKQDIDFVQLAEYFMQDYEPAATTPKRTTKKSSSKSRSTASGNRKARSPAGTRSGRC